MKESGESDPGFGSFTTVKNVMLPFLYVTAQGVKTIHKQQATSHIINTYGRIRETLYM